MLEIEVKSELGGCQGKTPDVGVQPKKSAWNGGTELAVDDSVRDVNEGKLKIATKSVFEVNHSRLAIGMFSRPLLDSECRKFRKAWEMSAFPGLEDFQVDRERVSFVAPPEKVPATWERLDSLLTGSAGVKKAS